MPDRGGFSNLGQGGLSGGMAGGLQFPAPSKWNGGTTEYQYLQFGTVSGSDALYDIKVLSDGNFAVLGYSSSSAIDGIANPYAASYFIAIIYKNLPPSRFIKSIYWMNATGYRVGNSYSGFFRITTDENDNVYFMYGSYGAPSTMYCYKLNNKLSLVGISSASITCHYCIAGVCYYGGKLYVAYYNNSTALTGFQRIDAATMVVDVAKADKSVANMKFSSMDVNANGCFIWDDYWRVLLKITLAGAYSTRVDLAAGPVFATTSQSRCLVLTDTNVVVFGSTGSGTPLQVASMIRKQSDLSAVASPGIIAGVGYYMGASYAESRLFLLGGRTTATYYNEIALYEFNPITGAGIANNVERYANDVSVRNTAIWIPRSRLEKISAGKYVQCGYIGPYPAGNGDSYRGFSSSAGSYDAIISKTDLTCKMAA